VYFAFLAEVLKEEMERRLLRFIVYVLLGERERQRRQSGTEGFCGFLTIGV
jgi:hypothetical protein